MEVKPGQVWSYWEGFEAKTEANRCYLLVASVQKDARNGEGAAKLWIYWSANGGYQNKWGNGSWPLAKFDHPGYRLEFDEADLANMNKVRCPECGSSFTLTDHYLCVNCRDDGLYAS